MRKRITPQSAPMRAFRDFLARALASWQRKQARATLAALSDETLRDIGITRGEIAHVANHIAGPVPRPAPAPPAGPADVRIPARKLAA